MKRLFIKIFPKLGLQILFFKTYKKFYNSKNPANFYEKLIWLNFNEYSKNKTSCADKYMVRDYLKKLGLEKYLNELYGVYDNAKQINFDELPDQFALKCNHGANFNIVCHDKSKLDITATQKKLNKWLRQDFSLNYAEMHYRNIPRKIVCEKFLGSTLSDYKVYCFNGKPKYVMVCTHPSTMPVIYYLYSFEWEYIEFLKEPISDPKIEKPESLDELYNLSVKLSSEFKFVRIDTYIHNDKIIFGEMTFTPSGFLDDSTHPNVIQLLSDMIKL